MVWLLLALSLLAQLQMVHSIMEFGTLENSIINANILTQCGFIPFLLNVPLNNFHLSFTITSAFLA
jgi:hypothetical protein